MNFVNKTYFEEAKVQSKFFMLGKTGEASSGEDPRMVNMNALSDHNETISLALSVKWQRQNMCQLYLTKLYL